MTLVEISEREVIEKAKAWSRWLRAMEAYDAVDVEEDLDNAIILLEAREINERRKREIR